MRHVPMAHDRESFDRQNGQAACLQFEIERLRRYHRQAMAGAHRLLDGRVEAELTAWPNAQAMRRKVPLCRRAGAGAWLADDQRFLRPDAARSRVLARPAEDQALQ